MRARRSLVLPALVATLAAACGQPPLPPRLAGLARSRIATGRHAARLLERAHGKDVGSPDSLVASYGRSGELRVWMSRYRDFPTAHAELSRMLRAMRAGSTPLLPPREDPRFRNRWTTVGNGAHHLVWVSGRTLYWLEGEPTVVSRAADDLPPPSTAQFL